MTDTLARPAPDDLIEDVVIHGNLSGLTSAQKSAYYAKVCSSLGLNPYSRPFEYLTLQQNKLTLYARKDATDQLRSLRRVSLTIVSREVVNDVYVVTARATLPDGRTDEEIGAVAIGGLKGESYANAIMKASTKAKRRVTLSVCGLGWLDETEVDTIPGAHVHHDEPTPIGQRGRAELEAPAPGEPSPRARAVVAEMDAAVAEADALVSGELPGPAWGTSALGQEVSLVVDEFTLANEERVGRGLHPIRYAMPLDNATDDELRQWIAARRRSLKALEAAAR